MFNWPFGNDNVSVPQLPEITPQDVLEKAGIPVTEESLKAQAELLAGKTQEEMKESLTMAGAVKKAADQVQAAWEADGGELSRLTNEYTNPQGKLQAKDMEHPFAGAYPGDMGSDNVRDYIVFTAYSNEVAGYTKLETIGSQSQGGEPEGTVQLYIPENLSVNSQVGYRNTEGGSLAGTMGNLFGADGDDDASSVSGNLLAQILGQGGQQLGDTGAVAAQVNAKSGLGAANRHVLFEGVDFRTFSYAYEFLPKSWDESDMLRKIIKFFRIQMLPEIRGNGNTFKAPNWFSIEYMIDGKPTEYLNKIKPSVCTGCDVSYGGNGQFAMFQSDKGEAPAPALINLTLTFQEVQVVSKIDALGGF